MEHRIMRYCKNCKHDYKGSWFCAYKPNHNDQIGYTDYALKRDRNSFGNCIYYKKVWWKFWVKHELL